MPHHALAPLKCKLCKCLWGHELQGWTFRVRRGGLRLGTQQTSGTKVVLDAKATSKRIGAESDSYAVWQAAND